MKRELQTFFLAALIVITSCDEGNKPKEVETSEDTLVEYDLSGSEVVKPNENSLPNDTIVEFGPSGNVVSKTFTKIEYDLNGKEIRTKSKIEYPK